MIASTLAPLAADLEGGLRRLKLASMRAVAPQLLITAKTQRWSPEELLRALVETEINARDAKQHPTLRQASLLPDGQDHRRRAENVTGPKHGRCRDGTGAGLARSRPTPVVGRT